MTSQPGPIDATAKPVPPLMPRARVLPSPRLFRALLILDHLRDVVGAEPPGFGSPLIRSRRRLTVVTQLGNYSPHGNGSRPCVDGVAPGTGGSDPSRCRASTEYRAPARRGARRSGRSVRAGDEQALAHPPAGRNRRRRTSTRRRPGSDLPAPTGVGGRAASVARSAPSALGRPAALVQATRGEEAMTAAQTVSSEVEVGVDPSTAFKAFTEEMDLWWVRGPINFWADGGRVVEGRCESGVGGRIMEILAAPAAEGVLERARITCWEPGTRLAWASSLDDVETEVSFVPTEGGTRVVVEHRIPAGGQDKGGTAWSRVVPGWFGAWCAT